MCGRTCWRSTDSCAPAEKLLFEKLITVSGIGPKLAITILSGMAADEMVNAIRGNDIARLTRIPGIGKKTAERMVLELRDKLAVEKHGEIAATPALSAIEEDVLSALVNLGYQRAAEKRLWRSVQKWQSWLVRWPCFAKLWQCFRNNLLSDTEPAEDQIQNVIVGGGARDLIQRTQRTVQIEQDHLVRNLASRPHSPRHQAQPVSRAPGPDAACW